MDELTEKIATPPVEGSPEVPAEEETPLDDWTEADLDEEVEDESAEPEKGPAWEVADDDAAGPDANFWSTIENMEEQGMYREADMLKMQFAASVAKQQLLKELGPQLATLNSIALDNATKDLDPLEREYIERVFVKNGIGYDMIATSPLLKEVARDAARGWQGRNSAAQMPGGEGMGGFTSSDVPSGAWSEFKEVFSDLNPSRDEFERIAREGKA